MWAPTGTREEGRVTVAPGKPKNRTVMKRRSGGGPGIPLRTHRQAPNRAESQEPRSGKCGHRSKDQGDRKTGQEMGT